MLIINFSILKKVQNYKVIFFLQTTYRTLPDDGMMSMTMYNGLNCPIPYNVTMYSKYDADATNQRLSEITFDFSNINTDHIEHLNAGPEVKGQYSVTVE